METYWIYCMEINAKERNCKKYKIRGGIKQVRQKNVLNTIMRGLSGYKRSVGK